MSKYLRLYVRDHPDEPVGINNLRGVHPADPAEVLAHPVALRYHDLVRQQRGELHEAGLITDEEYAALAKDAGVVARLESYDKLRAILDSETAHYVAEKATRIQYQTIVYDVCNVLDRASGRSSRVGTGHVVTEAASGVLALVAERDRLRDACIKAAETFDDAGRAFRLLGKPVAAAAMDISAAAMREAAADAAKER